MEWAERMHREASRWAAEGFDLLFPPRCVLCRSDIPPVCDAVESGVSVWDPPDASLDRTLDRTLCQACIRAVSTDVSRCLRCGEPVTAGDGCSRCRGRRCDWDGIAVLAAYGDRLRDAVLRAKHPGGIDVCHAMATLLVRKQRNTFAAWHIDAAVPVPMHWFRRAVRGTNAADEAARLVARLLGVRFQVALSRSKATRMQNEIPVHERRGNVSSAFQARRSVSGKRILLVDDVVTTGATLAACRTVLVAAGASAVFVTALAKADRSENATRS